MGIVLGTILAALAGWYGWSKFTPLYLVALMAAANAYAVMARRQALADAGLPLPSLQADVLATAGLLGFSLVLFYAVYHVALRMGSRNRPDDR